MKKTLVANAALLIAVVALGWFALRKPPGDEPAAYALSTLKASEVKHVRLERSGQVPIVLERTGGRWFITAPLTVRAEPFNVERVLAVLDAKASDRLAASDLARFDLDQPKVRLTIDSQAFGFGTVSTIASEQYVLTADAVYPVALRYGAALPSHVAQLIERRLFASGEAPARFEFEDFTVASAEGKWTVTPAPADVSQDDINGWVDGWRQAYALRAEPDAKGKAVGEIRIQFKDGKRLTLGILQREPELVLFRPDENLQYSFLRDAAKRLLSPPGGKR
jgi:hypothetical protein